MRLILLLMLCIPGCVSEEDIDRTGARIERKIDQKFEQATSDAGTCLTLREIQAILAAYNCSKRDAGR